MNEIKSLKIVLGSGSPRRKQLLAETGFNFEVRSKEIDETPPPGLKRAEIAVTLSMMKAEALRNSLLSGEILITADTIVCLGENVLNKPHDKAQAKEMLELLSGKIHQVYTGVCISTIDKSSAFSCETNVEFNLLSNEMINEYIDIFAPFDKAGSYGAQESLPENMNPCSPQEIGFMNSIGKPELFERTLVQSKHRNIPLIKKIEGSYFNVMGLPVVELINNLNRFTGS